MKEIPSGDELKKAIDDQRDYEETVAGYPVGVDGCIRFGRISSFNLAAKILIGRIEQELRGLGSKDKINYLDVGCWDGRHLYWCTYELRKRKLIKTYATSLWDFIPANSRNRKHIDDYRVGVAAETLPPEWNNNMDVVVANNSFLYWSNYPKIALEGVVGTMKSGGCLLMNYEEGVYEYPSGMKYDFRQMVSKREDLFDTCEFFNTSWGKIEVPCARLVKG